MRPARLILLSILPLAAACQPPSNTTDARLSATGELIALSGGGAGPTAACATCHGLQGQGDGDSVPRLAGLDVGYLQKQMEDYASGIRPDDVMGPIARRLSDADRRKVSAWYAGMTVPQGAPPTLLPPPPVWLNGDPARGVVACAACHGDAGQGAGPGGPAVAGQPAPYLLEQMRRWKQTRRRNDPRGVMTAAIAPLSDAELSAIAGWLSSRSPAPAPDSDAPISSASALAAAGPAASRETRRPDR